MKKIAIISQARMGSSRLPGKILKQVLGKPLLQYHFERLQKIGLPVLVATTTESADDQVEQFCQSMNIQCYRGSEKNVLSRFLKVIDAEEIEVVIRVTSDCPLIDAHLISEALVQYLNLNNPRAYLSNAIERTYARGFDFEIFSAELLRESALRDQSSANVEHVTPYLYSKKDPSILLLAKKQPVDHSFLRVTVDEERDFELIKVLIESHSADQLNADQIEKILINHPELQMINREVEQKKV